MNNVARNIVESMNSNIFSVQRVDARIMEEVPFFRKLLLDNINNHEVFHGYINKINDAWGSILKNNFKRLISHYNDKYNISLLNEVEKQNEMIRMAQQHNAEQLFNELEDLSLTGSVNFLTNSLRSSGITKKKPSKRR